jgi:hypothetical protein
MAEPSFDVVAAHRWFAIETNNQAWGLLEHEGRTMAEDDLLVHQAHASCYHWLQAGAPVNHQRALVLLANAYAAVGLGEAAVHHAKRALGQLEEHAAELADWDRAFTYDAAARAYAVVGGRRSAADYRARARSAGDAIADPEDRRLFDEHFARWAWSE